MLLCPACLLLGYCRKRRTFIVSDAELANPDFIGDVRAFAGGLCISRYGWREYLTDKYRDYPGQMIDQNGREVFLDMEVFEAASPYWFRDNSIAPRPGVKPRVRGEGRERFRVMATILRASFPDSAQFWAVRPANDNEERGGGSNLSPRPCL